MGGTGRLLSFQEFDPLPTQIVSLCTIFRCLFLSFFCLYILIQVVLVSACLCGFSVAPKFLKKEQRMPKNQLIDFTFSIFVIFYSVKTFFFPSFKF